MTTRCRGTNVDGGRCHAMVNADYCGTHRGQDPNRPKDIVGAVLPRWLTHPEAPEWTL